MKTRFAFAALVVALGPGLIHADVADSASNGFTVKIAVTIQASPADVYRRLVRNVGDWWDPQHTYSNDAHNLSIDDKPMGCFCEKLPNHGGVRHLEVVHVAPGKTIAFTGALGPLQTIAAAGNMAIELSSVDGGTRLVLVYSVAGYLPAGMNAWAGQVDSVLTQQVTRLKNYVEHGDPAFKGSPRN